MLEAARIRRDMDLGLIRVAPEQNPNRTCLAGRAWIRLPFGSVIQSPDMQTLTILAVAFITLLAALLHEG
jgi:hypothetical protein